MARDAAAKIIFKGNPYYVFWYNNNKGVKQIAELLAGCVSLENCFEMADDYSAIFMGFPDIVVDLDANEVCMGDLEEIKIPMTARERMRNSIERIKKILSNEGKEPEVELLVNSLRLLLGYFENLLGIKPKEE